MIISIFTDEINRNSPERAIKLAKTWGVTHVEVRSLSSGRFTTAPDIELEEVRRSIVESGLTVSGVSPGFFKCVYNDPSVSQTLSEGLPRACEWAKRFGTDLVSCFAFKKDGSGTPPSEIIDLVGQMADIVTENDCRLVLENEATCWGATGIEAEHIIRKIGSERIRLCWDPGNSARAGSTRPFPDEYESIKDLVSHVHIKNFSTESASWGLVDNGVVDWPGQIASLISEAYEGYLVIETHIDISPDEFKVDNHSYSDLEKNTLYNLERVRSYINT